MTSQPNDFAADVLNSLKKRKVTFHGCLPSHLELFLDGRAKMWFHGKRKGKDWHGGITVNAANLSEQYHMGNSHIVAELIEKLIDGIKCRYDF